MGKFLLLLFTLLSFCFPFCAQSQTKQIHGEILDKQSDEPISFATVRFTKQGGGVLTDSLGRFSIILNNNTLSDTLQITSVGYVPFLVPAASVKDSSFITIQLTVLPSKQDVI